MNDILIAPNVRDLSDMHKDAYGFRPSPEQWARWNTMNNAQLDAEEADLAKAIGAAIAEEEENEAFATVAFEAHIAKLIADFNIDRATAIRWDIEAVGLTDDVQVCGMSAYAFEHGLPYRYFEGGV
jgi:hypothetical protein